jgi:hypothetical protein
MSMPTLKRRLQVLLDDDRYERLRRRAEETGDSVGEVVRGAIDEAIPRVDPDRAKAIEELLALPPMPVDDWEVMKREIEEMYDPLSEEDHLPE